MRPSDRTGVVRRKLVAMRLREFFGYLLGRFSAGSRELLDKAERDSTERPQPSSEKLR